MWTATWRQPPWDSPLAARRGVFSFTGRSDGTDPNAVEATGTDGPSGTPRTAPTQADPHADLRSDERTQTSSASRCAAPSGRRRQCRQPTRPTPTGPHQPKRDSYLASCVRSGWPGGSVTRFFPALVPATVSDSPVSGLIRVRPPPDPPLPFLLLPMSPSMTHHLGSPVDHRESPSPLIVPAACRAASFDRLNRATSLRSTLSCRAS